MVDMNMEYVLGRLEGMKRYLTVQEYRTIRGQINAGDVEGANRGLDRLLKKRGIEG